MKARRSKNYLWTTFCTKVLNFKFSLFSLGQALKFTKSQPLRYSILEVNKGRGDSAIAIYEFVMALKDYGTDFNKIGKVIPSKTPKEWELFYMENKKKFNFENHVKQYEKKHRH